MVRPFFIDLFFLPILPIDANMLDSPRLYLLSSTSHTGRNKRILRYRPIIPPMVVLVVKMVVVSMVLVAVALGFLFGS